MNEVRQKVFVGMSGGVDSSVSAALLLRDGYEVVGVFIKVWQADFLPCTWREERREAMRAAAHLGIPLVTLDLEQEYKEEVVDYMIREYGAGRIPNPDVMCNKHVKFGAFLDYALAHGADFIATGHYAAVEYSEITKRYKLRAGADMEKDQSYFLWTLSQQQLAHTLFPVGRLQKSKVRALAKEFGLPNAMKKDSQGLCFMGAIDVADFLKHYLNAKTGSVLDVNGEVVGTHQGAMLYTFGQRHGFHTTKQSANELPLYVVAKDIDKNTITVSTVISVATGSASTIHCSDINDIANLFTDGKAAPCEVRVRYRGVLHEVEKIVALNNQLQITFADAVRDESIAPGQSIVFYREEECLGGGVITVA